MCPARIISSGVAQVPGAGSVAPVRQRARSASEPPPPKGTGPAKPETPLFVPKKGGTQPFLANLERQQQKPATPRASDGTALTGTPDSDIANVANIDDGAGRAIITEAECPKVERETGSTAGRG